MKIIMKVKKLLIFMKKTIFFASTVVGFAFTLAASAHGAVPLQQDSTPNTSSNLAWHKGGNFEGTPEQLQQVKKAVAELIPLASVYGTTEINSAQTGTSVTNATNRARWRIDLSTIWGTDRVEEKALELEKAINQFAKPDERKFLTHARLVVTSWDNITVEPLTAQIDLTGYVEFFDGQQHQSDPAGQFQVTIRRVAEDQPWLLEDKSQVLAEGY